MNDIFGKTRFRKYFW